jgi:hypothetical protein
MYFSVYLNIFTINGKKRVVSVKKSDWKAIGVAMGLVQKLHVHSKHKFFTNVMYLLEVVLVGTNGDLESIN